MSTPPTVNVNGTDYRWPLRPVVVVCIDGGDPRYLKQFLADGSIPNIARCVREGYAAVAEGSMPSFTCPNNMSIDRGAAPSATGPGRAAALRASVLLGAVRADGELEVGPPAPAKG